MVPGRPHERVGDDTPRWMTVACLRQVQNPAYRRAHTVETPSHQGVSAIQWLSSIFSSKALDFSRPDGSCPISRHLP